MASCELCDKQFRTKNACIQHGRDAHYECRYCDQLFWNQDDVDEHEADDHCWQCDYCDYEAAWEYQLNKHLSSNHNVCLTCKRSFRAWTHLQQHINSGVHDQTASSSCPFCHQSFRKMSALTMHLENGHCPNKRLTRNDVKQFVRHRERQLNMQGTLLVPRLTYSNEVPARATEASWNGHAYECCMCSREFWGLSNLNAHLISHEPKDYRCAACDRQFNVLSAVIQHWELSRCGHTVSHVAREVAQLRLTF